MKSWDAKSKPKLYIDTEFEDQNDSETHSNLLVPSKAQVSNSIRLKNNLIDNYKIGIRIFSVLYNLIHRKQMLKTFTQIKIFSSATQRSEKINKTKLMNLQTKSMQNLKLLNTSNVSKNKLNKSFSNASSQRTEILNSILSKIQQGKVYQASCEKHKKQSESNIIKSKLNRLEMMLKNVKKENQQSNKNSAIFTFKKQTREQSESKDKSFFDNKKQTKISQFQNNSSRSKLINKKYPIIEQPNHEVIKRNTSRKREASTATSNGFNQKLKNLKQQLENLRNINQFYIKKNQQLLNNTQSQNGSSYIIPISSQKDYSTKSPEDSSRIIKSGQSINDNFGSKTWYVSHQQQYSFSINDNKVSQEKAISRNLNSKFLKKKNQVYEFPKNEKQVNQSRPNRRHN